MTGPAECCGNCRFHQEQSNACRRFPPTPFLIPTGVDEKGEMKFINPSAYPQTHPEHGYCGEFRAISRIIQ